MPELTPQTTITHHSTSSTNDDTILSGRKTPPALNLSNIVDNYDNGCPAAPRSTLRVIPRDKQVNVEDLEETCLSFNPNSTFSAIKLYKDEAVILQNGHKETPWKIFFGEDYSSYLGEVPAGSIIHLDEDNNVILELAGHTLESSLLTE